MKNLIVAATFLFVFSLGYALYADYRERKKIIGRLDFYGRNQPRFAEGKSWDVSFLGQWYRNRFAPSQATAHRGEKLANDLYWAEVFLKPDEYRLMKILLLLTFFLALLLSRDVMLSLLVMLLSYITPDLIVRMRKNKNRKLLGEQIYYSIGIISGSLQAGHSLMQSMRIVATEIENPIRREYNRIIKEINLGIPVQTALNNAKTRVDTKDFALFVNAVLIQLKTGGNLAEILDSIGSTIRERQKLDNELKTLTAQGRLSAGIILLLPVALAIILYVINPDHIMVLFTTTLGRIMLGTGLLGQATGMFIINKIIKLDSL